MDFATGICYIATALIISISVFASLAVMSYYECKKSLNQKVQKLCDVIEKDEYNELYPITYYRQSRTKVLKFFRQNEALTDFIIDHADVLIYCPNLDVVLQHHKDIKHIDVRHQVFKAYVLECHNYDVLMFEHKTYILPHNLPNESIDHVESKQVKAEQWSNMVQTKLDECDELETDSVKKMGEESEPVASTSEVNLNAEKCNTSSEFGSLSSQRKRSFKPPPPQAPDNPYRKPPPKRVMEFKIGGDSYSHEYQPKQSPLRPVKYARTNC